MNRVPEYNTSPFGAFMEGMHDQTAAIKDYAKSCRSDFCCMKTRRLNGGPTMETVHQTSPNNTCYCCACRVGERASKRFYLCGVECACALITTAICCPLWAPGITLMFTTTSHAGLTAGRVLWGTGGIFLGNWAKLCCCPECLCNCSDT